MSKVKAILLSFLLVVGFFIVFKVEASSSDNVTGWAWGNFPDVVGGILRAGSGWISFNCYNDYNGDGVLESHCTDAGYSSNYGVNLSTSTLKFSGRAWLGGGEEGGSSRPVLGWLSFERSETGAPPSDDPCPDGTCIAKADNVSSTICDTDNNGYLDSQCGGKNDSTTPLGNYKQIFGWARFCGIPPGGSSVVCGGDGWDGWVKFSHNGAIRYGTTINWTSLPREFLGWAWGSDVVGWISFNCKNQNSCSTSSYKVYLIGQPPSATNLQESFQYCQIQPGVGMMSLSWTYSDYENTNQSAYSIEVQQLIGSTWQTMVLCDNIPTSGPPSGGIGTSAVLIKSQPTSNLCDLPSYVGDIEYGRSTRWRVKVRDGEGIWSEWTGWTNPTTTKAHAYPWIDFSWTPQKPKINEVVQFIDQSNCYDTPGTTTCSASTGDSFFWTFQNGNPSFATSQNPTTTFSSIGSNLVTLRITDSSGDWCENSKTVTSIYPFPFWKEIPPRIFFEIRNFFASLISTILKFKFF
jgi:hypothetical protein